MNVLTVKKKAVYLRGNDIYIYMKWNVKNVWERLTRLERCQRSKRFSTCSTFPTFAQTAKFKFWQTFPANLFVKFKS